MQPSCASPLRRDLADQCYRRTARISSAVSVLAGSHSFLPKMTLLLALLEGMATGGQGVVQHLLSFSDARAIEWDDLLELLVLLAEPRVRKKAAGRRAMVVATRSTRPLCTAVDRNVHSQACLVCRNTRLLLRQRSGLLWRYTIASKEPTHDLCGLLERCRRLAARSRDRRRDSFLPHTVR